MIRRFDGKVAVVTGAASGIGLALSRELGARGAVVALVDVDPRVREVASELPGASAHVADVADRGAMRGLADEIVALHGRVHLLVNNAGVSIGGRFDDVSDEDFEWLFGVNFWGVVNGCRAFLPALTREREAHIVNVCSSFAWLGFPKKSAYASSKAAVRAFSESLRAELADSTVGVTLLFPGPVDTNLVRGGRSTEAGQREREADFIASRAVDARRVARRCLAGVKANRARVLVGLDYRALDAAVRCAPALTLAAVSMLSRRLPF
jgi:NAD(P)-dependent dehydrogenase (short-subunit alcohol dehydrogenase family)